MPPRAASTTLCPWYSTQQLPQARKHHVLLGADSGLDEGSPELPGETWRRSAAALAAALQEGELQFMMQAQNIIKGQFSSQLCSQTVSAFLLQVSLARKANCLHYKGRQTTGVLQVLQIPQNGLEPAAACTLSPHARGALRKWHSKMETWLLQQATGAAKRLTQQVARAKHSISFVQAPDNRAVSTLPHTCPRLVCAVLSCQHGPAVFPHKSRWKKFSNRTKHHRKAVVSPPSSPVTQSAHCSTAA